MSKQTNHSHISTDNHGDDPPKASATIAAPYAEKARNLVLHGVTVDEPVALNHAAALVDNEPSADDERESLLRETRPPEIDVSRQTEKPSRRPPHRVTQQRERPTKPSRFMMWLNTLSFMAVIKGFAVATVISCLLIWQLK